ncbi:uncharacterized protein LOC128214137 [Mya arenaria]|uniref:uncharacterized protein LOC128214137 n=1 Tax=Mya arenaria TaxID=6604 RepID=UPI0022E41CEF|nr:uncharacterized protein LOC128214137 [Mya arenaria]
MALTGTGVKRKTCYDQSDEEDEEESSRLIKRPKTTSLSEAESNPRTPSISIPKNALTPFSESGYGASSFGISPGTFSKQDSSVVQPASNGYSSGIDSDCGTPKVTRKLWPSEKQKETVILTRFGPDHLKKFLQKNYILLKDEIDPKGIADILRAKGVIRRQAMERLGETKSRAQQADILIKAIAKSKMAKDVNVTRYVLDAFTDEGREDLFVSFEEEIDTSYSTFLPTYFDVDDIEEKFLHHWKDIEDEIDPLAIIDQLLAKFVLSFDEHENIRSIEFKPDKMLCLCEYVLRKSWKAFGVFCQTLKEEPIYSHIADKLISETRGRKTQKEGRSSENIDFRGRVKVIRRQNTHDIGYGMSEITYNLGSKELERMIVEDYSDDDEHLHAEAMDLGFEVEEVKFSSIKIKLSSLSCQSQAEFLRRLKESDEFVGKILKAVLKKKHLKKLREAEVSEIPFRVTLQWPKPDQVKCLCSLKKEHIVEHFTKIEGSLKHADEISRAFGEFEGFPEEKKNEFLSMKTNENDSKADALLRKILDGNTTHLCLLERELRNHGYNELLRDITSPAQQLETDKIPVEYLERHKGLLFEEIEPRRFLEMVAGLEGSDEVVETIMNKSLLRRQRCNALIEFIKKKNAMTVFVQELKNIGLTHVAEKFAVQKIDSQRWREAIIFSSKDIVNEIEPSRFKTYFRTIESSHSMNDACSHQSRRERAVFFLKCLTKGSDAFISDFISAMGILGYDSLLQTLKERAEQYKDCPRLAQSMRGNSNIVACGNITVLYNEETEQNCPFKIYVDLKANLTESGDESSEHEHDEEDFPSKNTRTKEWVIKQIQERKRKHEDTSGEEPLDDIPMKMKKDDNDSSTFSQEVIQTARADEGCDHFTSVSSPKANQSSRHSSGRTYPTEYEDISPPSSPASGTGKGHQLFRARYSFNAMQIPLGRRRNSLSDGASNYSSIPSSTESPSSPAPLSSSSPSVSPVTVQRRRVIRSPLMSLLYDIFGLNKK